jgi:hypothetical protein
MGMSEFYGRADEDDRITFTTQAGSGLIQSERSKL